MEITHNSNFLIVNGLARSGTTLLAQCLNNHPKIMCLQTVLNELVRAFMIFANYEVLGKKGEPDSPIDHFFFMGNPEVKTFIEKTDFRHEIPDFIAKTLPERIANRTEDCFPVLKKELAECHAETFDELILKIFRFMFKHNGSEGNTIPGAMLAFSGPLLSALSNTFPNMKFANIIRDPRAIITSNYLSNSLYPVVFSVRDWRKLVYYTWRYQESDNKLQNRFVSLKYENLVQSPEETLTRLTQFVGLEYDPAMLAKKFTHDTHYTASGLGESTKETERITVNFIDKWKTKIPLSFRIQIESFCLPEMKKMGYCDFHKATLNEHKVFLLLSKENDYSKLGGWCQKMVPRPFIYKTGWRVLHRGIELMRLLLFGLNSKLIPRPLFPIFFYEKAYFEWLKKT